MKPKKRNWEKEIIYRGIPLSDYRAAIIEECARVVDYRAAHWPDDACRELLILAAAAIRVLKDKA